MAEDRSQEQPIKIRVAKRWDDKFLVPLIEYLLHKNACCLELVMLIRVIKTIHAVIFSVMQSFKICRRLYKNDIICPGTTSINVARITVRR